jgi:NMD protein affecting ribosome stability and mRNA decay
MGTEKHMNAPDGKDDRPAAASREVRMGEPECPRCRKSFTASYWSAGVMVQARCLSCDLKWPLPDVV